MIQRYILFFLIGVDVSVLLLQTSELSISYFEASTLYGKKSFLQFIANLSFNIFGQNDFGLRIPMIIFHISSVILIYKISKKYLKYNVDRIWTVIIFILLPGVISSSLIFNSAGIIIFGLLLFIYLYEKIDIIYNYILLFLYLFIDSGFIYLFFALVFYGNRIKNYKFSFFNIFLVICSFLIYGIPAHGTPKGHFLDLIALYSAIFSPIIFIYIFYVLYKKILTKEIELIWFISFSTLIISMILSFRQRIELEVFAPYLIISLPLAVQMFSSSYRVRLKMFRKKYKFIFIFSLTLLLINSFIILFNKELYSFVKNPKKHFAYKMYVAKELANKLKEKDIKCITTSTKMQDRLRFYGINRCNRYILNRDILNKDKGIIVTISYNDVEVYKAIVTKINIK